MDRLMSLPPPFPRARIPIEVLEATVEELLALGGQRGESLLRSSPKSAGKSPRDTPDIAELVRRDLLDVLNPGITRRDDEQLVATGRRALRDLDLPDVIREMVDGDLQRVEEEIAERGVLSDEARRRLRRFILTTRLQDPQTGATHRRSEAKRRRRSPERWAPIDQWSPDARALDVLSGRWTLLIVRDLVAGPRRFVELQRVLPGISTEQLRTRLNRMVADGLLTRQRYREVPPRVDYELAARGREVMPILGALARWGYDWAWTKPREGEAIDIAAIFRLCPALLSPPVKVGGTVQLEVRRPDGTARIVVLTAAEGHVELFESDVADPDARVIGTEDEWIEALSPVGSLASLTVIGQYSLVELLLADLVPISTKTGRRSSA